MSCEYVVASLPGLVFGEPPAMTVEQFRRACQGVLTPEQSADIERVLDGQAAEGTSAAARKWHGYDTQIRNALARARVSARSGEARGVLRDHPGFEAWIDKEVGDALAKPNPLEREMAVDRCRWSAADDLALTDSFGFAAIAAYAAKLVIAARWDALREDAGRTRVEEFVETQTSNMEQIK